VIEAVPTELAGSVHEDRHVLTVATAEHRIAVDVEHGELEVEPDLERAKARDKFIAQLTAAAAVDCQLNRAFSSHRP
jgi:hypothetical protein